MNEAIKNEGSNMSNLVVIAFPTEAKAEEVRQKLSQCKGST